MRSKIANNARRLLKDAEILFAADRYLSSTALSIICIEEVGKIIEDVLWGLESSDRKQWHIKKQKNVSLVISAQVCCHSIGENLELPRIDEETKIHIDDELAELLFPISDDSDEKLRGEKLGQYLFFKSGGKVDDEEIRDLSTYQEWLSSGKLHDMKNRSLYLDQDDSKDVDISDQYAAESTLKIAKYCVEMCRKL